MCDRNLNCEIIEINIYLFTLLNEFNTFTCYKN